MTFPKVCFGLYVCFVHGLAGMTNGYAACAPAGPSLTREMLSNFLDRPDFILENDASNTHAARAMSLMVSQYVAADQDAIQKLMSILPDATAPQRAAIGEGLHEAVAFCRAVDPSVSTRIEATLKFIGDQDVIDAYTAAEILAESPIGDPGPKSFDWSAKRSGRRSVKTEKAAPANPGKLNLSLQLSDPFASPDAWR